MVISLYTNYAVHTERNENEYIPRKRLSVTSEFHTTAKQHTQSLKNNLYMFSLYNK